MKRRRILLFLSFFLLCFGILPVLPVKAYSLDEVGDYTKISHFDPNGYSNVGVSVSVDGNVKYYVNDTWWRLGDSWDYVGTNISGNRMLGPSICTTSYSGVPILLYEKAIYRFQLDAKKILAGLPSDYSVITRIFNQGQETQTDTEYSFETHTSGTTKYYSIYHDNYINLSTVSSYGLSFKYEVYTPFSIGKSNKIEVKLPEGASLTKDGKAYVSADGYYIDQLPEIRYSKPGYTVEFNGWYDQKTGGNKITAGTILGQGKKLYAHFTENVIPFKITCYDILGTDISGKELGKHVFDAYEGDKVSGANVGNNTEEGAYYSGLVYHSCTEKTVTTDTAVYRFFTYPCYEVTYIDQISEGKDTGKELGRKNMQKELNTKVSGEDLGTSDTAGEYYKGYVYLNASSATVSKSGTIVYRYFKPHVYRILFHGNGNTGGSMENLEHCAYEEEVTLPKIGFEKNLSIHLDGNGENVTLHNQELTVAQKFLGWSMEIGGDVRFDDQAIVSNLTDTEDSISFYAVWSEENIETDIVPERKGYEFLGWSKNPEAKTGTMQFTLNQNTTLYAIWKQETAKYRLEYDFNDGTMQEEGTQPKKKFQSETELSISNLPEVKKEGYEFAGWNTRADGSGITLKTDADLVKVFSEDKEASLYAIWQPAKNTAFTLKLYKDNTKELLDTLVLKGTTGEKISEALKKIYANSLGEDQVWQFYTGYEVINKEVLEELIKADSSTEVTCYLTTRTCEITLIGDSNDTTKGTSSEKLLYKDSYTLPKSLENETVPVDRYRDSDGNFYEAGEKITLEKNKTFYAQHLIRFYSDGTELKEKACYIDHGKKISLPSLEKKGYQFLGWKEKNGSKVYQGDDLGAILKGYELYAAWSEPNTYKISYEIEDHLVKIAENKIMTYQFGKETLLPDKMQVIVETGYEFKGWYLKDDPKQTLITKISKEQIGDIVLKAKLVKTEETNPAEKKTEQNTTAKNTAVQGNPNQNVSVQDTSKQTDASKQADTNAAAVNNTSDQIQTTENNATNQPESTNGTPLAENNTVSETGPSSEAQEIKNPSIDSIKQTPNATTKNKTFQVNGFKYRILSEKKRTVTLVSGTTKKATLTIPKTVHYHGITYTITEIGKKAFSGNKAVKKLVISSGIRKIKASAFQKMKNLTHVKLGKNVTNIEKKAFYGNKKLAKVNILSKKLKSVNKTAFKGIRKTAVFKVPAGKSKAYKKFLHK